MVSFVRRMVSWVRGGPDNNDVTPSPAPSPAPAPVRAPGITKPFLVATRPSVGVANEDAPSRGQPAKQNATRTRPPAGGAGTPGSAVAGTPEARSRPAGVPVGNVRQGTGPSQVAIVAQDKLQSSESQTSVLFLGDGHEFVEEVYTHLVITDTGIVYRSDASMQPSLLKGSVDSAIELYTRDCVKLKLPVPQRECKVVNIGYLRGIKRKNQDGGKRGSEIITQSLNEQEHHIADWVRQAITIGASDLEYRFNGRCGFLRVKWRGAMTIDVEVLDEYDYASRIMPACWNMAKNTGDVGSYNNNVNQGRRLPGSVIPNVPDGYRFDGIRLTYLRYNTDPGSGVMFMRLFANKGDGLTALDTQGWDETYHIPDWHRAETLSGGLVALSGEVGHGKSTTMSALLKGRFYRRNQTDNMITVEDIIELPLPFTAHQIQLPPATDGSTIEDKLDDTLGWIYRANPTTLMVNEAKDSRIFKGILRTMLNGTTVFTTAHTKSALLIPVKLQELQGDNTVNLFDPELIPVLSGQRLCPQLCRHCCLTYSQAEQIGGDLFPHFSSLGARLTSAFDDSIVGAMPLPEPDEILDRVRFANPKGCEFCSPKISSVWAQHLQGHKAGTQGRTVIGELVMTTHKIMAHLGKNDLLSARRAWVEDNGVPMQRHALAKIAKGLIDPREVETLLGDLDRFRILTDFRK